MSIAHRVGRQLGLPAFLAVTAPAALADITVPTDLPLGAAIALATDGEVITVLPGTYDGSQGFQIANKTLTLRGSTGNPADVVLDGFNVTRILLISGSGADGTTLEHLTLTRGVVTESLAIPSGGGAVKVVGADVTLHNCRFIANEANVTGEQARGGAVYGEDGSLSITSCLFQDNHANDADADGGAVFLIGAQTHLISGCTFEANSAPTGGALRVDYGTAQVTGCSFTSNAAIDDPTTLGGALFARFGAHVTIDGSTFVNNDSGTEGGALATLDANTVMIARNCLFQGNTAGVTGGVGSSQFSAWALTNCTFEANAAGTRAVVAASSSGSVAVRSSILWNNVPAATPVGGTGAAVSVAWSIVQGGFPGAGNIGADPLFVAAAGGNLQLLPGSPAIDAGSTTDYVGPFADLLGAPRGVDDPDTVDTGLASTGPVIDIGAYEFQVSAPPSTCPADLDGNGLVATPDFLALLQAWGDCP